MRRCTWKRTAAGQWTPRGCLQEIHELPSSLQHSPVSFCFPHRKMADGFSVSVSCFLTLTPFARGPSTSLLACGFPVALCRFWKKARHRRAWNLCNGPGVGVGSCFSPVDRQVRAWRGELAPGHANTALSALRGAKKKVGRSHLIS